MGAGIGAIFRAPLGGAMMAAEIMYRHDLEVEVLIPSLIALIVGYSVYGWWTGWSPVFGSRPELAFSDPRQLGPTPPGAPLRRCGNCHARASTARSTSSGRSSPRPARCVPPWADSWWG